MFVKSDHGSDLSIKKIKKLKSEATKWNSHSRTEMQCSVRCRKLAWDECNAFELFDTTCILYAMDQSQLEQLNGTGLYIRQKEDHKIGMFKINPYHIKLGIQSTFGKVPERSRHSGEKAWMVQRTIQRIYCQVPYNISLSPNFL